VKARFDEPEIGRHYFRSLRVLPQKGVAISQLLPSHRDCFVTPFLAMTPPFVIASEAWQSHTMRTGVAMSLRLLAITDKYLLESMVTMCCHWCMLC